MSLDLDPSLGAASRLLPLLAAFAVACGGEPGDGSALEEAVASEAASRSVEADDRRTSAAEAGVLAPAPGRWVDRPDEMFQLTLYDYDRFRGDARFLYTTHPSLEQGRSGDWAVNVYVVHVSPDGEVSQRHVHAGQELIQAGSKLALRRDHDQVIVELSPREQGDSARLELWSAQDGTVLSSAPMPAPTGPAGERFGWTGITPTPDGNFIRTTTRLTRNAPVPQGTVAWIVVTPEGEVLRQGEYSRRNTRLQLAGQFATADGRVGLVVNATARDDAGLADTDVETPVEIEVGERTVEARVYGEKRLLLAERDGTTSWLRPALERQLTWGGEVAIPQDLPAEEMMEQNAEQMARMAETEVELHGRRAVEAGAVGNVRQSLVGPTPEGFGALLRVTANRRLEPPVHGSYYLVFDGDGVVRELYLEPVVEDFNPRMVDFAGREDGSVVILAEQRRGDARGRVLWIAGDGVLRSSAPITEDHAQLAGLVAGPDGVWAVGHGFAPGTKNRLWVERVDLGG